MNENKSKKYVLLVDNSIIIQKLTREEWGFIVLHN